MSDYNKRLLLEIDKTITDINRNIINPRIDDLTIAELSPLIEMVATARADYLESMLNLSLSQQGKPASVEQLKRLRHLRLTYEELSSGAQALETAIERGYLDVTAGNAEK